MKLKIVEGFLGVGQLRVVILLLVFWIAGIALFIYTLFCYLQQVDYLRNLAFSGFFLILAIIITIFFYWQQKNLKWIEEQKKILDDNNKK
jgi:hypothetical protein